MARLSDAEVTFVENGPICLMVKVISRYIDSTLTQYCYPPIITISKHA